MSETLSVTFSVTHSVSHSTDWVSDRMGTWDAYASKKGEGVVLRYGNQSSSKPKISSAEQNFKTIKQGK